MNCNEAVNHIYEINMLIIPASYSLEQKMFWILFKLARLVEKISMKMEK